MSADRITQRTNALVDMIEKLGQTFRDRDNRQAQQRMLQNVMYPGMYPPQPVFTEPSPRSPTYNRLGSFTPRVLQKPSPLRPSLSTMLSTSSLSSDVSEYPLSSVRDPREEQLREMSIRFIETVNRFHDELKAIMDQLENAPMGGGSTLKKPKSRKPQAKKRSLKSGKKD